MLVLYFTVLAATFVTSYRIELVAPKTWESISDQTQEMLIDINSAETYLVQPKISYNKYYKGFDPLKSKTFINLNSKFTEELDSAITDHQVSFSGYFGEDIQDYSNGQKVSFGVLEKMSTDPTTAFYNDTARTGRIGLNPWVKSKSNLGKVVLYNGVLGLLAKCFTMNLVTYPKHCYAAWIMGDCMTKDKVDQTNITIPVKPHQKSYWQIEVDSYSYDKLNYNKKFNVVLSTTTLDFTVSEVLFNIINKTFNTKQTEAGKEFDCSKRGIAKDITFKFNGQTVVIPGRIYADQVRDKCYLRLRPSKNDEWVLGLQFYYAYAACFDGNKKSVQLNKSLYGEFTD